EILHGGFIPNRSYLLRGGPGTGKTTLGLHFLTEGVAKGERTLYIALSEPEASIRQNAERLGFDLTDVAFLDLSPSPEHFLEHKTYEVFSPAEVEAEPATRAIIEAVERYRPQRVVVDPMSQIRHLATDVYHFRQQLLSFLHFLMAKGATVLFTSETIDVDPDVYMQVVADGVLTIENLPTGLHIRVSKFRGSGYIPGLHGMQITPEGVEIYPRLVPEEHNRDVPHETIPFGLPELDKMLSGGLERGSVSLITGPSGTGKTTLGLHFMHEAAMRGERSVIYTFEEDVEFLLRRAEALKIPVRKLYEEGMLKIEKIEPLIYSADQFARKARVEVEKNGARVVMIDSTAGYRIALKGEDVVEHLHALAKYLQNMGVAVLLVTEGEVVGGSFQLTGFRISYLADSLIYLRYVEKHTRKGLQLAKAVGVLKKRLSAIDPTVRELVFTEKGMSLGPPLRAVEAFLSHHPRMEELGENEA
ncbi:MAG: ATPase domain-containing protein, partial [Candidatus Sericytochromatia bacterium]